MTRSSTMMMMMKVMMILSNLGLLTQDPGAFILFMVLLLTALVASFTVHEFSHALAATTLGDNTAARLGRLSLNPKVHLDPAGSVMVLLAGFGWGKPVPVNPRAFGAKALRYMMLVAVAGPLANFAVAFSIVVLFKIGFIDGPERLGEIAILPLGSSASAVITQFFAITLLLNLVLGLFNLIPLAPLDGSSVMLGLVPKEMAYRLAKFEHFGPRILMGIILLDIFANTGIISKIIDVPIKILEKVIL